MRRILLISFVTLSFFCVGFKLPSHRGPEDFDHKTINLFKKNFKGGMLTAFHGAPSMRGTIKQASYWLLEKEVFKGKYLVVNSYQEKEFILFCLLDYRQVKFNYKKQNDFTHRFSLKSGEDIIIPIELGHLPKGAHDIIIALAEMPEKDHVNFYTDTIRTHRVNVFVESTSFPKSDITDLPDAGAELKSHVFNLSFQNPKRQDSKKVNLSIGNASQKDLKSLILLFDNFLQIEKENRFIEIDQKQQVRIDFDLENDLKMMFCLKINNPYTILEPKPNVLSSLDTSVESSNYLLPDKGVGKR